MPPTRFIRRSRLALTAFLETEASGGIALFAAALAAMLWANLSPDYEVLWRTKLPIFGFDYDLRHWVNDGLMTFFFLVVGLEIKRELVTGELAEIRVATLPLVAAFGGMIVPAVVYLSLNTTGEAARGWAIPMATDIAFVVGTLAILGRRVPDGLKLFLLTVAIVDDVGTIAVIAVFYSRGLDVRWFALAIGSVALIVLFRRLRGSNPLLYLIPGVGLWVGAAKIGVHPTLAGVALGLLTPARPIAGRAVLEELEHRLHPLSSYLVVPVFGLANAGVVLSGDVLSKARSSTVVWGIVAGLVLGKAIGVFGATRLGEALHVGRRPAGVGWTHIGGGATLSGIGFTVSLFITGLAFTTDSTIDLAKIGVLSGSVCSAVLGTTALLLTDRRDRSVT